MAQLHKTFNEAVTTMLAYEVFDPKNTSPCLNIVIYRFIYISYVLVNIHIVVIIPSPGVF